MANTQELTNAELQKLIPLIKNTQWQYKLDLYENAALKEIEKSVNRARIEMSKELKKFKPTSTFSRERTEALGEELQNITVAIQAQISNQIGETAVGAGKMAYPAHNDIISFGGLVPNFNPVSMSAAQLAAIVKTPVGGKQLNEWVKTAFDTSLESVFKSEIMTGMLKGESYKKLVRRFDNKAYDMVRNDIEGLTRTYVQSINVRASEDVMKANSDIVKGKKWNSTLENRTCIRCISRDSANIIYPIDGPAPDMPLHVRCRCFWEIITKTFREMGIDVDEIRSDYRAFSIRGNIDPTTGKFTKNKVGVGGAKTVSIGRFMGTYDEFFKSQTKEIQIEMLGPSRYALWKSGKMKLSKMTDKSGKTILLKDLPALPGVKKVAPKTRITKPQSTTLSKSLFSAESEIYSRKTEKAFVFTSTGESVFSRTGGVSSVKFTTKEAHSMVGNILTHNHPMGSSFSFADIRLLNSAELKEIRAVSGTHTHSASLKKYISEKMLATEYNKSYKKTKEIYDKRIHSGHISVKEANENFFHTVWLRVARNNNWLIYERKSWQPSK